MMKRRICAIVLSIMTAISMTPMMAFADDIVEPGVNENPLVESEETQEVDEDAQVESGEPQITIEEENIENTEGIQESEEEATSEQDVESSDKEELDGPSKAEEKGDTLSEEDQSENAIKNNVYNSNKLTAQKRSVEDSGTCGQSVNWTLYSDGELRISGKGKMYDYDTEEDIFPPWRPVRRSISSVVIEPGVTSIGNDAFDGLLYLNSVSIPSSVVRIGTLAFEGTPLQSVTIPGNVNNIGERAFADCDNLATVEITSVINLGDEAFFDCDNLTSVEISGGLSVVHYGTFWNCTNLKNVKLPDNVTTIKTYAFNNCKNLSDIVIPSAVNTIESSAFSNCKSLSRIDLPDGLEHIQSQAFEGCSSLMSIEMPASVISIGEGAFEDCSNLKTAIISNSITVIPGSVFRKCISLESITIPEGVKTIFSNAFYGCESLKDIIIPTSVTEIKSSAFARCKNLMYVELPDNLKELSYQLFYGCTSLKAVYTPTGQMQSVSSDPFGECTSNPFIFVGEDYDPNNEWQLTGPNVYFGFSRECYEQLKTGGNGTGIADITCAPESINSDVLNLFTGLEVVRVHYEGGIKEYRNLDTLAVSFPDSTIQYSLTNNDIPFDGTIKDGDRVLIENSDFKIVDSFVSDNLREYHYVLQGQGDYFGSYEVAIDLALIPASDVMIEDIPDQLYEEPWTAPQINATYQGVPLEIDRHYTVTYDIDVPNGRGIATITLGDCFEGTTEDLVIEKPFVIYCERYAKNLTVGSISQQTYTGSAIKPKVKITYNGEALKEGEDYKLSYKNNINAGKALAVVTFTQKYDGKTLIKEVPFTILPRSLGSVTFPTITAKTYDGKAKTPSFTPKYNGKKLVKGTDYTVTYSNNVKAGKAKIVVKGKGNYTGTKTLYFTIKGKLISKCKFPSLSVKTWDGKAKTPLVTVKDGSKKLIKGTNYTISYSNNKNVGKAKIVIKGKGNYRGTKTLYFKIRPKGTSISSITAVNHGFTVKWKKQNTKMSSSKITGYQIQYSTSSSFAKDNHTKKISGVTHLSKKVTGLKGLKKYYVRVRTYKTVNGVTYYSAWSSAKSVKTKHVKTTKEINANKVYNYIIKNGYIMDSDLDMPGDYCIESRSTIRTVNGRLVQDYYIVSIKRGVKYKIYLGMHREYIEDTQYTHDASETAWIECNTRESAGPVEFHQIYYVNSSPTFYVSKGKLKYSTYTGRGYSEEKGITNLTRGWDDSKVSDRWDVRELFDAAAQISKGTDKLLNSKMKMRLDNLGFYKL